MKNSRKYNVGKDNPMFGKKRPDLSKYNKEHRRFGKLNWKYRDIGSIHKGNNDYNWIKTKEGDWITEHRHVVIQYIGYNLRKKWRIHHIDGNHYNNHPSNLYIFKKVGLHSSFEALVRHHIVNRFILKSNLKEFKINEYRV